MKTITLTNGQVVKVDDDDYEKYGDLTWRQCNGYASRELWKNNKRRRVYLHRLILGEPSGMEVDHANGDKLDNRKVNLRIATKTENRRNIGMRSNNTSGYKGVFWHKRARQWRAGICVDSKALDLGSFETPEAAAQAYNEAAKKHHGEYAWTNPLPAQQ